jgi:hypothetical protein
VTLNDVLPAGTTFRSLVPPAGWGCTTPAVGANGTITCSIATFGVDFVVFAVTIRIDSGTVLGASLYHDVDVSTTSTDRTQLNNDDGATTLTAAGPAAAITATGGTPQSALVGSTYASPLQATVTDSFGNPVQGVTVTFTAPGSGPSGTFPGSVLTANADTEVNGVATSPTFTANTTVGGFQVTATANGVQGSALFLLSNVEGESIPTLGSAGLAAFLLLLAGAGILLLRRLR